MKAGRREIIQSLSTVMNDTMYPSTADCEATAARLIGKFKKLKDGCGSGYVNA